MVAKRTGRHNLVDGVTLRRVVRVHETSTSYASHPFLSQRLGADYGCRGKFQFLLVKVMSRQRSWDHAPVHPLAAAVLPAAVYRPPSE